MATMREFLHGLAQQTPRIAQTLMGIGQYYDDRAFRGEQLSLEKEKVAVEKSKVEATNKYTEAQTKIAGLTADEMEKVIPLRVDMLNLEKQAQSIANDMADVERNFGKQTYDVRIKAVYEGFKKLQAETDGILAGTLSEKAQTALYGMQSRMAGLQHLISFAGVGSLLASNEKDAGAINAIVNKRTDASGNIDYDGVMDDFLNAKIPVASDDMKTYVFEMKKMRNVLTAQADAFRQQQAEGMLTNYISIYAEKNSGKLPSAKDVEDQRVNINKIVKMTYPNDTIWDRTQKNIWGSVFTPNLGDDKVEESLRPNPGGSVGGFDISSLFNPMRYTDAISYPLVTSPYMSQDKKTTQKKTNPYAGE